MIEEKLKNKLLRSVDFKSIDWNKVLPILETHDFIDENKKCNVLSIKDLRLKCKECSISLYDFLIKSSKPQSTLYKTDNDENLSCNEVIIKNIIE